MWGRPLEASIRITNRTSNHTVSWPDPKRLLRRMGLDVGRYRPSNVHSRRQHILRGNDVDLGLDVGANTGQYATFLRSHGYGGKIVSVEPHSENFQELEQVSAQDPDWTALNLALSDREGTRELHVSGMTTGNSFHELDNKTTEWIPEFSYVGSEQVEVNTVDAVLRPYEEEGKRILIKVDTQGHEAQVLGGAKEHCNRWRWWRSS